MAEADILVAARDAGYRRGSAPSFEYVNFQARADACLALIGSKAAAVRDVLLAVAGVITPTTGSLVVRGAELPASHPAGDGAAGRLHALLARGRGARMPRGSVGLGVVSGAFEVEGAFTVEEAVRRERLLRRVRNAGDTLEYLSCFGLATYADRTVASLPPEGRARLSAALACAGGVRVACVDLADPFCAGMMRASAARVVGDLARIAREQSCALVVGTVEPTVAVAADEACALDLDAADALAACKGADAR